MHAKQVSDLAAPARRGVVTPEAVVLEFETASIGSRVLAELIDLMVLIGVFYVGMNGVAVVAYALPEAYFVVSLVLVVLVVIGYPIVSETLTRGRTLGKAALGLRVVTTQGGPVSFRHAAVRGLVGIAELWLTLGGVAMLTILVSRQNQRFGDLAAGTVVVRAREADNRSVAVSFPTPPGMEAYAASLDVSSVTPAQYTVIRSFLMRVFELTPQARAGIAIRLANPVATAMHHAPPPLINPEVFLACVASAYQRRHGSGGGWWPRA